MTHNSVQEIPKILWIYWDRGVETAPQVVQLCVESWKQLNPDWDVRVLSDVSRGEWVNPEQLVPRYSELTIQKRANLLRKLLLATYGGVWADATVLCVRPLSEWLPMTPPEGFLLFDNKAPDRYICNWFIGSTPGNRFITEWFNRNADFFRPKKVHRPRGKLGFFHRALLKYTRKNHQRARFWTSWFGRKVWRTYPYYISHYLAAEILFHDVRFATTLERNPLMRQPGPLSLKVRMGSYTGDFWSSFLRDLEEGEVPMLKLNKIPTSRDTVAIVEFFPEIQAWLKRRASQRPLSRPRRNTATRQNVEPAEHLQ